MAKANRYKSGVEEAPNGVILADDKAQIRFAKKYETARDDLSAVYTPKESYISYNFVLKSLYGELKALEKFTEGHDSDFYPENISRGVSENKKTVKALIDDFSRGVKSVYLTLTAREYPTSVAAKPWDFSGIDRNQSSEEIDKQLQKLIDTRFAECLNEKNTIAPKQDLQFSDKEMQGLRFLRAKMQKIIDFQSNPRQRIFALNGANLAILKELTGMLDAKMASDKPVIFKPVMAKIYNQAIKVNSKLLNGETAKDFDKNLQEAANFYQQHGTRLVAVPYWKGYKYLAEKEEPLKRLAADLDYRNPDTTVGAAYKNYTEGKSDEKGKWTHERYNAVRIEAQKKLEAAQKEFKQSLQTDSLLAEAYHRREINQAKTCILRAAWNGYIVQPEKEYLSETLRAHLNYREANLDKMNVQLSENERTDAQQKFSEELAKNEIWQLCEQSPAFAAHKKDIISSLINLNVPPEMVEKLNYSDLTHLMNQSAKELVNAGGKEVDGVKIDSDKEKFLRRIYNEHKDDIRMTLEASGKEKEYIDDFLNKLKNGKCNDDFDVHHDFEISDPEAFEQATGESFIEMNNHVTLVSREMHLIYHLTENYVTQNGRSSFKFESVELAYHDGDEQDPNQKIGNAEAHRTIFEDKKGNMFYLLPMPEEGIDCVMGDDRYIFNKHMLTDCLANKMADVNLFKTKMKQAINSTEQTARQALATVAQIFRIGDKKAKQHEGQAQFISITGQKIDGQLKTAEITEDLSQKETQRQIDIHSGKVRTHVEQEKNGEAQKSAQSQDKQEQRGKFAPRIGNLQQRRDFSQNNGRFNGRKGKIAYGG